MPISVQPLCLNKQFYIFSLFSESYTLHFMFLTLIYGKNWVRLSQYQSNHYVSINNSLFLVYSQKAIHYILCFLHWSKVRIGLDWAICDRSVINIYKSVIRLCFNYISIKFHNISISSPFYLQMWQLSNKWTFSASQWMENRVVII